MGMTLQLLAENGYKGSQFISDLLWLVVIIVSIAGALMTLYAVYIAYLFFTASDANKRTAAKNRLVKVFATFLIVVALDAILGVIRVEFNSAEGNFSNNVNTLTATYSLHGVPELQTVPTSNGSFKLQVILDAKNIYGEGKPVEKNGASVKFLRCSIIAPKENPAITKSTLEFNDAIGSVKIEFLAQNNSGQYGGKPSIKRILCNPSTDKKSTDLRFGFIFELTFVFTNDPEKEISFQFFADTDSSRAIDWDDDSSTVYRTGQV